MYFNAKAQKNKEEIHIFLCISSFFSKYRLFLPRHSTQTFSMLPVFNKAFSQHLPYIPYDYESIPVYLVYQLLEQHNLLF